MVLLLVGDIGANSRHIGFADGKYPIARLPGKPGEFRTLGFDPSGRGFFHIFHCFAYGYGPRKIKESMDVILRGIDQHRRTVQVLEHSCHVAMERFPHLIVQETITVLGAENEMDVETGERLGHEFKAPFQGFSDWLHEFLGRCPRLWLGCPFGAKARLAPLTREIGRSLSSEMLRSMYRSLIYAVHSASQSPASPTIIIPLGLK